MSAPACTARTAASPVQAGRDAGHVHPVGDDEARETHLAAQDLDHGMGQGGGGCGPIEGGHGDVAEHHRVDARLDRGPEGQELDRIRAAREPALTVASCRWLSTAVSPWPGKCLAVVSRPPARAPSMKARGQARHERRVFAEGPDVDDRVAGIVVDVRHRREGPVNPEGTPFAGRHLAGEARCALRPGRSHRHRVGQGHDPASDAERRCPAPGPPRPARARRPGRLQLVRGAGAGCPPRTRRRPPCRPPACADLVAMSRRPPNGSSSIEARGPDPDHLPRLLGERHPPEGRLGPWKRRRGDRLGHRRRSGWRTAKGQSRVGRPRRAGAARAERLPSGSSARSVASADRPAATRGNTCGAQLVHVASPRATRGRRRRIPAAPAWRASADLLHRAVDGETVGPDAGPYRGLGPGHADTALSICARKIRLSGV